MVSKWRTYVNPLKVIVDNMDRIIISLQLLKTESSLPRLEQGRKCNAYKFKQTINGRCNGNLRLKQLRPIRTVKRRHLFGKYVG